MYRISCILIFIMLTFLLSGCEDSNPDQRSGSALEITTPIVQPTVAAVPDQASMRSKLQALSFGHENENGGQVFRDLEKSELPVESFQIVYQLENVSMNARFEGLTQKEYQNMIDHIQIEGNVDWRIDDHSDQTDVISIRFSKPKIPFVLHLGDLPAITFKKMEPLSYTYESSLRQEIPHLLLWAREYGTRLLVPDEQSSVILSFTEKMQKDLPTTYDDKPIDAVWLDNTHLRIQLKEMGTGELGIKEIILRLDSLKAESGNYLDLQNNGLIIRKIPQFEWHKLSSSKQIGFSPRDRFYDQIVMASDQQSYVGIVKLGGSMGDGDGTSYSFILESKGQEPVVIEPVFYSTIEPGDLPIQWIDDKTLFYSSYFGAYTYDIENNEKNTLHEIVGDEKQNINYAAYDPNEKAFHILAYSNRNETNQLDLWKYKRGENVPQRIPDYTATVMVGSYSFLDMNIISTSEGMYWTHIAGGIPVTDFVNNSNQKVSTEGIVRLVSDRGVYLERFKPAESRIESIGWVYWSSNKTIKAVAKPPDNSFIFVSGVDLFAQMDTEYYKYNQISDKWMLWQPASGDKEAVPVKGSNGLYRINKHASKAGGEG